MAQLVAPGPSDPTSRGRMAALVGLALLALALPAVLPGCGGCQRDPAQAQKDKEKEEAERRAREERAKPKPDFEITRMASQPFSGGLSGRKNPPELFCKPGHWTATMLAAKTNNFDFRGEMETVASDRTGRNLRLESSTYDLAVSRSVALPKGEPKLLDALLFVPCVPEGNYGAFRLNARRGGRRVVDGGAQLVRRMPSYQYHFLVLASAPSRYAYLDSLHSVKPPGSFDSGARPYYNVVLVAPSRRMPLPWHPVFWTSTAHVLWDDLDPTYLAPEQQQAMVDWLHWGGQLILSGPDTLDRLRDSFLADYLPADAAGVREYGADALEPLQHWAVDPKALPLAPARPLSGVALSPRPEAQCVSGAGELLVERRVGRGRVVATAFRLSARELASWSGFDCFFNACLLRRPPRRFVENRQTLGVEAQWADGSGPRYDAALVTALRYFSRDACSNRAQAFQRYGRDAPAMETLFVEETPPAPGMAAWNDFGDVSREARRTLETAAQIRIPQREFVVWIVGGYLIVLVPLNWLSFRLIGRVEWAWAAAPLIALVCTIVVIRLAQLDIGFVRSQNEVAIVELHANHARAHVTRYNAFYTSLATGYEFRFDDRGAVALPLPEATDPTSYRPPPGAWSKSVTHVLGDDARLEGFTVASNSVGMIHSEEMVALGGALELENHPTGGLMVRNGTALALRDAWLARKTPAGEIEAAWLGAIEPGSRSAVVWRRARPREERAGGGASGAAGGAVDSRTAAQRLVVDLLAEQGGFVMSRQTGRDGGDPRDAAVSAPGAAAASDPRWELPLDGILMLAADPADLEPGETRFVAHTTDRLPGLTVKPAAPQVRRAAVVIAHLEFAHKEAPKPDVNACPKLAAPLPGS